MLPCVLYYQGREQSGNGSMDDLLTDEAAKKKKEDEYVSRVVSECAAATGRES